MGAKQAIPYKSTCVAFQSDRRAENDVEFRRNKWDSLVLMSFNLRAMDQPDESQNSWSARKRAVVRVLQKYKPDVIATQEGFRQQLDDIFKALPHYKFVGQSRCHPDDQEHCAVFVNTIVLEVSSQETIWLSETPAAPKSKSWDSSLPRIATMATVRHLVLDVSFTVVSTHFDHRGVEARQRSCGVITERLGAAGAVVLAGDFNLTKGGEGSVWQCLRDQGFKDALLDVDCQAPQDLSFHGFSGGPFPMCPASGHRGHIDWIMARSSDTLTLSPLQAVLVPLTWAQGEAVLYPSDHLPLAVEFALHCPDAARSTREAQCQDIESRFAEQASCWEAGRPRWTDASSGSVGGEAVLGGHDGRGEFFVGRALHGGAWVPGKISAVDGCCYVPSGGQEHKYSEYQALDMRPGTYRWEGERQGAFAAGAVPVGRFFVARGSHGKDVIPGKLHPEEALCYFPHHRKEHSCAEYEVLVSDYHSCVQAS